MTSSDRLLDLPRHDLVRSDVPGVVDVPVEARKVVEHKPSIYTKRIYAQAGSNP